MPSDTNCMYEQTPRAVSSGYVGEHLVVTFHYNDGRTHEIVCNSEEELHRAQMLADRVRVTL